MRRSTGARDKSRSSRRACRAMRMASFAVITSVVAVELRSACNLARSDGPAAGTTRAPIFSTARARTRVLDSELS